MDMESQPIEQSSSNDSTMSIDSQGLVASALEMMDDEITPTVDYVLRADELLRSLDQPGGKLIDKTTIEVKRVLQAMIDFAPCDRGRRYATCSIVACCQSPGLGGINGELYALAHDWFKFLLLAFRMAYKSNSPLASLHSTISVMDTEVVMEPAAKNRPKDFVTSLKQRDQNNCVVYQMAPGDLEGAHILRRTLASGNNSKAGIHVSVPTTWNILRHYADIDEDTFKSIGTLIDLPENGMMLEISLHRAFDKFQWYLECREEPNSYNVKWLTKENFFFAKHGHRLITFSDASGENIPLPRRQFIRIHAAMAQILHASGVGEFLDTLVDKFLADSSVVPVGKFGSGDLDLRIFLMGLADQNFHHLPAHANEIFV